MATVFIGKSEINLNVIGAGLRNGLLPSRLPTETISWNDLDVIELADLEAFEAAGWSFHPQKDLNWRGAEELNGGMIRAGLLARHSWGGLVVVPNDIVVVWPEGSPPSFDPTDEIFKLPVEQNVHNVRLHLPDANLEETIVARVAAYRNLARGDDDISAEPMLLYHLVHRGVLFKVGTSTALGQKMDPTKQWHWKNIQLSDAWDKGSDPTRRGKGVRVGVIDLGFNLNETQIKSNIAETAFLNDAGIRVANPFNNAADHGTLCAGLVGALLDGQTVNGAAADCTLMLVAVESITAQVALEKAIELCRSGIDGNPGAPIISCSIGPTARSWELTDALRRTLDAVQSAERPLIVWADFDVHAPILSNSVEASDGVLCVGQSNSSNRPGDCGFGPQLDLLAPGVNVTGIKATVVGASAAAPIVAGVAALMFAKNPGLSGAQLANVISQTCDRADPNARTDDEGWGTVNAARAVDNA